MKKSFSQRCHASKFRRENFHELPRDLEIHRFSPSKVSCYTVSCLYITQSTNFLIPLVKTQCMYCFHSEYCCKSFFGKLSQSLAVSLSKQLHLLCFYSCNCLPTLVFSHFQQDISLHALIYLLPLSHQCHLFITLQEQWTVRSKGLLQDFANDQLDRPTQRPRTYSEASQLEEDEDYQRIRGR